MGELLQPVYVTEMTAFPADLREETAMVTLMQGTTPGEMH